MTTRNKRKPMTVDAILDDGAQDTATINVKEIKQEQGAGQRAHVKQLTLYLPHPVYRLLRELAFHEERRMHSLVMEGLDRLFADRGVASIAELTRES